MTEHMKSILQQMADMVCHENIDKAVLPHKQKLEEIQTKIDLSNKRINQLMKELVYYTEEEYNMNVILNTRHYEDTMDSNIIPNSIITTHMKTLNALKKSLDTRTDSNSMFQNVIMTLEQWIDEQKALLTPITYPYPDIVDMSYTEYCGKKEIDIMTNPKLAPLLQKINEIKNILPTLYRMHLKTERMIETIISTNLSIKIASQNGLQSDDCWIY